MDVNSAFQSGLTGIQRGQAQLRESAQTIAQQGTTQPVDNAELTEAVVDQIQAQRQVEASTEVVKSADETLGRFIDTVA